MVYINWNLDLQVWPLMRSMKVVHVGYLVQFLRLARTITKRYKFKQKSFENVFVLAQCVE